MHDIAFAIAKQRRFVSYVSFGWNKLNKVTELKFVSPKIFGTAQN